MAMYHFDAPDRFVAGTVGPPGGRTFFLQARAGRQLVTVSCEKQQVSLLADRVNDLLDSFAAGQASEQAASAYADDGPLDTPIEDEFRTLTLALAWEPETESIVIEAHSADLTPDEEGDLDEAASSVEPPAPLVDADADAVVDEVLRVRLSPPRARAFARRCALVVAAGRPNCPFCGGPLDPSGHICPRANGYKR